MQPRREIDGIGAGVGVGGGDGGSQRVGAAVEEVADSKAAEQDALFEQLDARDAAGSAWRRRTFARPATRRGCAGKGGAMISEGGTTSAASKS